jgi:predicted transcriptional regulator
MVGLDENSSRDMGVVLGAANLLVREFDACVCLVHHTGKAGLTERGSSSLLAGCNTMVRLLSLEGPVTVECYKQKDGDPFPPFRVVLEREGDSMVAAEYTEGRDSGAFNARHMMVLEKLDYEIFTARGGAKFSEIVRATEIAEASLYLLITQLLRRGLVETDKDGTYRLTQEGRDKLMGVERDANGRAQPRPGNYPPRYYQERIEKFIKAGKYEEAKAEMARQDEWDWRPWEQRIASLEGTQQLRWDGDPQT